MVSQCIPTCLFHLALCDLFMSKCLVHYTIATYFLKCAIIYLFLYCWIFNLFPGDFCCCKQCYFKYFCTYILAYIWDSFIRVYVDFLSLRVCLSSTLLVFDKLISRAVGHLSNSSKLRQTLRCMACTTVLRHCHTDRHDLRVGTYQTVVFLH